MVFVSTGGGEEHAGLTVRVFHVQSKATGSDPWPTQPNLQASLSWDAVNPYLHLTDSVRSHCKSRRVGASAKWPKVWGRDWLDNGMAGGGYLVPGDRGGSPQDPELSGPMASVCRNVLIRSISSTNMISKQLCHLSSGLRVYREPSERSPLPMMLFGLFFAPVVPVPGTVFAL